MSFYFANYSMEDLYRHKPGMRKKMRGVMEILRKDTIKKQKNIPLAHTYGILMELKWRMP